MKSLNLKKIIYVALVSFTMALTSLRASSIKSPFMVAITQIVPHPSLDLIRKGIEDELKEQKIESKMPKAISRLPHKSPKSL
jgi:ABC-type uncharacterized transport system substrate-binding protein